MRVRRSSPYLSVISCSSAPTMARCRASEARMSLRSAMSRSISASRSMILWISIDASRRSCWSRMKRAWSSSMSRSSWRPREASSAVREARISAMTSSSMLRALTKPRSRWARFSASASWKAVRRRMTSIWCLTHCAMNWSSRRVRGTSSTSASMLQPKVSCSAVCLYRLFITTRGWASRFSTITRRRPVRAEVSSRMSEMPVRRPEFTSSAILVARLSGLHM